MRGFLLFVVFTSAAVAQLPPAVINEDRTIQTRLSAIEKQLQSDSYGDAITALQQLADSAPERLVRVSSNRLLAVRDAANTVLAGAGPDALTEFRRRFDPQAKQWWIRAQSGEIGLLRQLSLELPQSNWADEATNRLGELAWRSGRPGLAFEYWSRLGTSECAGRDFDPAAVRARLVLCRLAMGERTEAARALVAFRQEFPTAAGQVGNRKGQWAELLEQELRSTDWKSPDHRSPLIYNALWNRRLLPTRVDRSSDRRLPPTFRSRPVAASQAVFAAGSLFVSDCYSLHVFDPQNGLNPWTGEADSRVFTQASGTIDHVEGVPLAKPATTDGRLLVRLGPPTTSRGAGNEVLNADKSNAIVCFDVDRREGKRLWQLESSNLAERSAFESDPVVFGSRSFVVLRESPPVSSLRLVCLSNEDGEVLWQQQLCSGLDEPEENSALTTAVRPVVSSTHIVVSTNNGVVYALRHDGRVAWARTYDRQSSRKYQFAGNSCVSRHARVYVAPRDSTAVMAIREHTGELIWQRRLPDQIAHMLPAKDGVLTVFGRAPWGMDSATGKVLWGGPRIAPEKFVCGRAAAVSDLLLIPTRDHIEVRRVTDGRAIQQPIQTSGGNITVKGGLMAITRGQSVSLWTSR